MRGVERLERNQTCPHCGAALPGEASFCPYCAESVNRRTELTPPSPALRRTLRGLALLAVLAAAALALFLLTRPRTLDGQGEVVYTDGGAYQLVLGWPDDRYAPIYERWNDAAVGEPYRYPVCLFVNHADSGADAGGIFLQKVESVTAELLPADPEGAGTASCTQPAPDAYSPGAALISYVDFTARDAFSTQMVWTLTMKNGDTIRLRQDLHVTPIPVYNYYPEDAPMDTLADLQALVDELAETVEPSAKVNLFLPPVTYQGSLVMEERPVNLYGSEENGRRTTFTGTLRVASRGSWITYLQGIDFAGDGGGVGVSASARLWVEDCAFTGWKTGVLGYGDAWVNVMGCTFTDNQVGFHFNSEGMAASDSRYVDNQFRDNGTAVRLERVPTDLTLDFSGSVFSGNGTDIDNACGHPIDITQAVLQ